MLLVKTPMRQLDLEQQKPLEPENRYIHVGLGMARRLSEYQTFNGFLTRLGRCETTCSTSCGYGATLVALEVQEGLEELRGVLN